MGYQRISAHQAHEMMQSLDSFVLLDVRSALEFDMEHIAGAILIPVDQIQRRAAAELPDRDAVILVYCRTGARANEAVETLAAMGYTQVFHMGGIVDWPFGTVP
jgi:rhodanese-related sulfurtransferase